MSGANVVVGNQTGIGAFTGLVQYNRIEANGVGIAATAGLRIFNNQIVANTTAGILAVRRRQRGNRRQHDSRLCG